MAEMVLRKYKSRARAAGFLLSLALFLLIPAPGMSPLMVFGESHTTALQPVESFQKPAGQASGVTPLRGPPGTRITISGSGFRDLRPVESITMGGVNILGNRRVYTDDRGNFQAEGLIVPGLDPGIVSLIVKVGTGNLETTSIGTFEITAPTGSSAIAFPVDEALAPLGDALERVFHFDNATKTWRFFDPRVDFVNVNTVDQIVEGQVYWIKVSRSVTATLNAKQRELTCSNEGTPQQDCWNLIVW